MRLNFLKLHTNPVELIEILTNQPPYWMVHILLQTLHLLATQFVNAEEESSKPDTEWPFWAQIL